MASSGELSNQLYQVTRALTKSVKILPSRWGIVFGCM